MNPHDPHSAPHSDHDRLANSEQFVEMPRPTAAPLVAALGLALLAAGVVTSPALLAVGAGVALMGLILWIGQWLPGRGHLAEPLVAPEHRPRPIVAVQGKVERVELGKPGYRLRLPEKMHPLSAGVKGGIAGGLVMPVPALAYGYLSGHGLWYPVNLLAGMVLPGVDAMTDAELGQFHLVPVLMAIVIHVAMAIVLGLLYGVLMPTLPEIPKALAWGGLLMPLLWTALSFALLGSVNPLLRQHVDWPWFVASQFVFGVVLAAVVLWADHRHPLAAGIWGGLAGGALMALPAVAWSLTSGRGLWYPVNLLTAMVSKGMDQLPIEALEQFRADWFWTAVAIHAATSIVFGVLLALLLDRLPVIAGPLAWGGLLMPLLWTAASYSLMGIVNPVLQKRVDWPWFIASQFIFGLVAAWVVVRSEQVHIPPAGTGPEPLERYAEG